MLKKAGIDFTVHRYEYDASADRVGLQAAEALAQPQDRVLKTLMALVEGQPVYVIVPSDREVSMKKLAAVFGGKFAQMMNPADAERISAYKVGGISRAHYRSTRSRPRVNWVGRSQAFQHRSTCCGTLASTTRLWPLRHPALILFGRALHNPIT